jgi:hypothetical protein
VSQLLAGTDFTIKSRNYQSPIWTGWEIIDPSPVEGSPRGSSEEADSFLVRSDSTHATSARVPNVASDAVSVGSDGSGATESTVVSDYGILIHGV